MVLTDPYISSQGEENLSHRLLRSVKNRYGSTDEVCNGSQGYSILYPYVHYSLISHISIDLFVLLIYVITLTSFIVAFFILFGFLRYIYLANLSNLFFPVRVLVFVLLFFRFPNFPSKSTFLFFYNRKFLFKLFGRS